MKGKADVPVELASMSDQALANADAKLYGHRAEAQVLIGKRSKKGPVEALSDDLPATELKLVTRKQIKAEIARRKGAAK